MAAIKLRSPSADDGLLTDSNKKINGPALEISSVSN